MSAFHLTLLLIGLALGLAVMIAYIVAGARQKRKAARGQLAEEERRKAVEAEEDRKFDMIIDCPVCAGAGVCVDESARRDVEDSPWISQRFGPRRKGEVLPNWWRDGGLKHMRMEVDPCPFCRGEGTAFACLNSFHLTCPECKGTRKMTVRQKQAIGSKVAEIDCGICSCSGSLEVPSLYVRTLHPYYGQVEGVFEARGYRGFTTFHVAGRQNLRWQPRHVSQ